MSLGWWSAGRHESSGAPPVPASQVFSSTASVPSWRNWSDRAADAPGQRRALVQHDAELLRHADLRQLPDDLAAVELRRGHVERGGQVDDQAVDGAVLQRLLASSLLLKTCALVVGLIRSVIAL
jgi:hypothetical protein